MGNGHDKRPTVQANKKRKEKNGWMNDEGKALSARERGRWRLRIGYHKGHFKRYVLGRLLLQHGRERRAALGKRLIGVESIQGQTTRRIETATLLFKVWRGRAPRQRVKTLENAQ
jgi:hypothetical protein